MPVQNLKRRFTGTLLAIELFLNVIIFFLLSPFRKFFESYIVGNFLGMQYSNWVLLFAFAFSSWHHGFAQSYKIGTIDIYGNRKISSRKVLAHLRAKEEDSITHENFKPADEAAKLKQMPGVKHATVSPVCCDTAGNLMLYIGIGETDSFILNHRDAPVQDIQLPEEMITAYRNLNDQMEPAIKSGQAVEDDSHGYALLSYKPARNEQNKFITFANRDFTLLANGLKKLQGRRTQSCSYPNNCIFNQQKKGCRKFDLFVQ